MKEKLKVFSNGLLKENPSLRLVLGTCPTLAVTTLAVNGLGMGLVEQWQNCRCSHDMSASR